MTIRSTSSKFIAVAAALAAGLVLLVASPGVSTAGKFSGVKGSNPTTANPGQNPIVRDHRGGDQTPGHRPPKHCQSKWHCISGQYGIPKGAIVRDHRHPVRGGGGGRE